MSINILDFEQSIRDKIMPLYVISGSDYYFRRQALDKLLELVSPDMADFNVTYISADGSVEDVLMATNTPPLMADYRLVVWRGDIKKIGKEQARVMESKIAEYMKSPQRDVILVAVDEGDYFKSIYKIGELVDCDRLETSRLVGYVYDYIVKRGCSMEEQLVRELVIRCDNDMAAISGELDKLCAYADGGLIDISAIDDVVTHNVEQGVFKLTDAISRNNVDEAYILLEHLLVRGEEPLKLLGLILAQYKRMFIARVSKDKEDDLAKKLGVKPYAVKLAKTAAAKYKPMVLKRVVDKLQNIEYDIKSGRLGMQEGLQLAMASVTERGKR